MARPQRRPRVTPPSAAARERLAKALVREVAEARMQFEEAVLRTEGHLVLGQDDLAADVLSEQRGLVAGLTGRIERLLADAAVEREAEAVLGALPATLAAFETGRPADDIASELAASWATSTPAPTRRERLAEQLRGLGDEIGSWRLVPAGAGAALAAILVAAVVTVTPDSSPDHLAIADAADLRAAPSASPSADRPALRGDDRIPGLERAPRIGLPADLDLDAEIAAVRLGDPNVASSVLLGQLLERLASAGVDVPDLIASTPALQVLLVEEGIDDAFLARLPVPDRADEAGPEPAAEDDLAADEPPAAAEDEPAPSAPAEDPADTPPTDGDDADAGDETSEDDDTVGNWWQDPRDDSGDDEPSDEADDESSDTVSDDADSAPAPEDADEDGSDEPAAEDGQDTPPIGPPAPGDETDAGAETDGDDQEGGAGVL